MSSANDISLSAAPAQGKEQFCKLWPTAKPALEHLRDLVKNPVVKTVIGTVIRTGDAVAGLVCNVA